VPMLLLPETQTSPQCWRSTKTILQRALRQCGLRDVDRRLVWAILLPPRDSNVRDCSARRGTEN